MPWLYCQQPMRSQQHGAAKCGKLHSASGRQDAGRSSSKQQQAAASSSKQQQQQEKEEEEEEEEEEEGRFHAQARPSPACHTLHITPCRAEGLPDSARPVLLV
jgi:hypothetical protein